MNAFSMLKPTSPLDLGLVSFSNLLSSQERASSSYSSCETTVVLIFILPSSMVTQWIEDILMVERQRTKELMHEKGCGRCEVIAIYLYTHEQLIIMFPWVVSEDMNVFSLPK